MNPSLPTKPVSHVDPRNGRERSDEHDRGHDDMKGRSKLKRIRRIKSIRQNAVQENERADYCQAPTIGKQGGPSLPAVEPDVVEALAEDIEDVNRLDVARDPKQARSVSRM